MSKNARIGGIVASMGIALLLTVSVPVLGVAAASGSTPSTGAPPQQWAYAGMHWINSSATTLRGQYEVAEVFGWTLVYTLTNTSNTTFELEAQRTMGLSYTAQLCASSCGHPTSEINLTIQGSERETAFANFTANATVDENGTMAPALGLLNTQSAASVYLNESMTGSRTTLGISRSGGADVDVSGTAHTQATFSPALGLIPWQLSSGLGWNASAAFSASGGFALSYLWSAQGPNGSFNGSGAPSGQLNHTGTVALLGMDLGNLTLADGESSTVIVLAWAAGPFSAVDGVILVPNGFDVFGIGPHPWGLQAPGAASVLTSRIDIVRDLIHHRLRIAAAASAYAGTDSLAPTSASATSAIAPAATPSALGGLTTVQAQPVGVPQADSTSACLLGHCGSSSTANGPGALRPLTELVVLAVLVVAIAGTVGAINYRVWSRVRTGAPPSADPTLGASAPSDPNGSRVPPPPRS